MAAGGGGRHVRQPVAAGTFYPRSTAALASSVDALLVAAQRASQRRLTERDAPRGIIVPHAGYAFSGPVAATAYARLASHDRRPQRMVILGPSHFHPLQGWAVPTHTAWRTPLGEVRIDDGSRQMALDGGAVTDDRAHRQEHSIEVQLPFVQRVWPGIPVLPIAVGEGAAEAGAHLLARVVSEVAILVVSTDLSHYHDAATAHRLDARTAAAIEALDEASIDPEDACGSQAVRVALAWARGAGLRPRLLERRDSSDAGGDANRVVGYGAFTIERPMAGMPTDQTADVAVCRDARGGTARARAMDRGAG